MRPKEERKRMTAHVAYEVAALEITSDLFQRANDRFVFEAFLIHARSLRDFFWEKKPRGGKRRNDVVAEEFFVDTQVWRAQKGPKSKSIVETWKPIDRQLSHLTWERIDRERFTNLERYVPALADELLRQWERFLLAVGGVDAQHFRDALDKKRLEVRTTL